MWEGILPHTDPLSQTTTCMSTSGTDFELRSFTLKIPSRALTFLSLRRDAIDTLLICLFPLSVRYLLDSDRSSSTLARRHHAQTGAEDGSAAMDRGPADMPATVVQPRGQQPASGARRVHL
ncbi:hypothetical protein CEXT_621101 [Caerostris extrusa]|uniref:Uncharacterized protein n=1 Tax=Caerostris extrusa TaxID=172846 RepID=A0AAV4Y5R2_CAEEX|nr:hypothetical protein CEXT_621101 [Caerostris extrusa]